MKINTMKQITNFEELKNLKSFIRFDKDSGEYKSYSICCKDPNNVEGYFYFFNNWTMEVERFHKSIMKSHLFYTDDGTEDFKLSMIKIKMDILNNKIDSLKNLYEKRLNELS